MLRTGFKYYISYIWVRKVLKLQTFEHLSSARFNVHLFMLILDMVIVVLRLLLKKKGLNLNEASCLNKGFH